MSHKPATLDDILAQSRTLSLQQRVRLIERIAADLEVDVAPHAGEGRSLGGLWSDLGPGLSEAELEQARQDAWAGFPRHSIIDEDR